MKSLHRYKVTFTETDVDSCVAIALAERRGASTEMISALTGLSPGQVSYRLGIGARLDKLPRKFGYRRWYRSVRNDAVMKELRADMPKLAAAVSERLGGLRVKPGVKFTDREVSQEPLTVDQAAKFFRKQRRLAAAA
jgi:hypothetical protein